jgi:hypothetical protein
MIEVDSSLNSIIQLQKDTKLNDIEFARSIGVSREYWNRIKRGKNKVTLGIIRRVAQKYPERMQKILGNYITNKILGINDFDTPEKPSETYRGVKWLKRVVNTIKRKIGGSIKNVNR